MSRRRTFDRQLQLRVLAGLGMIASPFVMYWLTDRVYFILLGVAVIGAIFVLSGFLSIGDKVNDWE